MERKGLLSSKAVYLFFTFAGCLFVFFEVTGRKLAETGNILWSPKTAGSILGSSIVLGGALGACLCFVLRQIACGKLSRWKGLQERMARFWPAGRVSGKKAQYVLLVSFLLILLAWLPAYLAYYPAICAYDSPVQTGQAVEGYMIDHHPIAHTLLLKGAMYFGEKALGSVNAGIGLYTWLQQAFLAFAFAVGVSFLWHWRIRRIWLFFLQLYVMCYPFHWYMSVSMTKDTVFSGFFLLAVLALGRILAGGDREKPALSVELMFFFSSIGMILFRNNGKYAFGVLLVFLLAAAVVKKKIRPFWRRLFWWTAGAFAAGIVILSVLFEATDAQQGDRREMLSMPIQQLARTMIYHGGAGVKPEDDDTMDGTDKALIDDFLLDCSYRLYDPALADPVKRHTNTYVARYRPADFLKTYLHLFLQYPGDYLNAALAVNAGYLSPDDVTHAYVNMADGLSNMGYVQTRWEEETLNARGIYKASLWPDLFRKMERWADENGYLSLPVLKYLFVPGTWLYLYLLLLGWLLLVGRNRVCMLFALIGGYYLTLFLGPTVQLRYIYPIMIAFPFFLFLCSGQAHDAEGAGGLPDRV